MSTVKETGGKLGFITPMTHNFCESCNRVRLTCTGTLYMCLGQDDAADLRAPLRASEGNELLSAAIDEAIGRKPKGHDFVIDRTTKQPAVSRHMSVTGGWVEAVHHAKGRTRLMVGVANGYTHLRTFCHGRRAGDQDRGQQYIRQG
jgi:hypothetical protein